MSPEALAASADLTILSTVDAIADDRGWTTETALAEGLGRRGITLGADALRARLRQLADHDLLDQRYERWGLGGNGWDLLHSGKRPAYHPRAARTIPRWAPCPSSRRRRLAALPRIRRRGR